MLTLKNERETLLAVAAGLEKGELIHVDQCGCDVETGEEVAGKRFNMEIACDCYSIACECYSIACIGGWAYLHENPKASAAVVERYVMQHEDGQNSDQPGATRLAKLYFPREVAIEWSEITREQAATAIRRYLAGEERIWDHVSE